jgi:hypothetical protein
LPRAPYQDIWRDGRLVTKGRRDCADRYRIILPALQERVGKGFTVADVGGWDGYFPIRLAEDLDAIAVNIDQRTRSLPVEHRVLTVTADTVSQVGRHDVILALSILHHMDDWPDVYRALRRQSRLLLVELAHPSESRTAKVDGADRNTAPSYRQVMDDGLLLGETVGPNRVRRPLVLVRNAAWGPVEDGSGQAAPLIAAADFSDLGYDPFPGSLNVRVGVEARNWLVSFPHLTVESGRSDNRYVPAVVNGVRCHAAFQRARDVVELIGPERLRDRLQVCNGDVVEVRPA